MDMLFLKKQISLFVLFSLCLWGKEIDTFYGPIDVEEAVLLELIEHPIFQRLKLIHQYGVSYYTTHKEEYNRYEHSLGVFAILRAKGASLEEQIAGLLHDVSHTAFSHVGDWVFGKEHQETDYQNSIHQIFLRKSGLENLLQKYGFTTQQILPEEEYFPALESSLPDLCADRIDYNIQGAYYQRFITHEEALEIFQDLQFIENRWVSTRPDLMKKIARFSLFMTQECWGSPTNHVTSRWLADAILRAIDIGCLSYEDLHFGTDDAIWNTLLQQEDSIIQQKMQMILQAPLYFSIIEPAKADVIVKSKFRGINPWILSSQGYLRLTDMDADLAQEYEKARLILKEGWPIKILSS